MITGGKGIGSQAGKRIENGDIKSYEDEPRGYRQSEANRTSEKIGIMLSLMRIRETGSWRTDIKRLEDRERGDRAMHDAGG
jgi:hypothetical protein